MHPTAVYLALRGCELLQFELGDERREWRVVPVRAYRAPAIFITPLGKVGTGRIGMPGLYKSASWDAPPKHAWERIDEQLLHHILGD